MDPDAKLFNMFFTKSDASVSSARGVVAAARARGAARLRNRAGADIPPAITSAVTVTRDLAQGLRVRCRHCQRPQRARRATAANAVLQGQELPGLLPDRPLADPARAGGVRLLDQLDLQLTVNGTVRQTDTTGNLVFKPAETISELSTFANVAPGDVLLTGTPSGCALRVPPPPIRRLVQLLPERQFWKLFLNGQRRRPQYLQPGDRINARIHSADGRVDLGEQVTRIE